MSKPIWVAAALAIVSMACAMRPASAQKLDATVLYRQNSDTDYNAVIPGWSSATDCAADPTDPGCSVLRPNAAPGEVFYNVVGTTLSLQLPDGRVAVLNCVNKFASRANHIHSRSCGMPIVDHVQAEFNGHRAKLEWMFSLDSNKLESETYSVVAVLDKRDRQQVMLHIEDKP